MSSQSDGGLALPQSKDTKELTAKQKSLQESYKLFYDLFKHITTLSTGSILIIVTLLEKVFTAPLWKSLIGISFGGFVLSILGSLIAMAQMSKVMQYPGKASDSESIVLGLVVFITIVVFVSGIVCFVLFALRNFYR